jgi:hypothetical protein
MAGKKTKYMAGGGKNTKYMAGGGKNSKYMAGGGKSGVEVGKEAKVEQYRDYVQRMFGGGMTEPAMKKKRNSKGMARGGKS